jgi:hypothetical protein
MRIAVTSTVVFEVPDGAIDAVTRDVRRANAVGRACETVSGRPYTVVALERFEVVERHDFASLTVVSRVQ